MQLKALAVGFLSLGLLYSSASATGGLSGYYEQIGYTSSSNSTASVDTTTSASSATSTGGLAGYYEQIGYTSTTNTTTTTTDTATTGTSTGSGGYSQYWEETLQANSFDYLCTPAPMPSNSTCEGGSFQPINNNYDCIVGWQCSGSQSCPVIEEPPASQCNGEWEAQYQTSSGCLTHYFCDKTPDEDQVYNCPLNYDPVCGQLPSGHLETYSNDCFMEQAGATFQYHGVCQEAPVTPAPVIHRFVGPGQLEVGKSGTWVVRASGGNGGNLSYSIDWGENTYAAQALASPQWGQRATFTHQYAQPGTYTVTVLVQDEQGQQVSSTATVTVLDETTASPPNIESFTGPETLQVGETGTWTVSATHPFDAPVTLHIDFGEVSYESSQTDAYGRYSETYTHAYNYAGTYTVKVTATTGDLSVSESLTVQVEAVPTVSQAPVINGISGPTSLVTGQTGTWTVTATDPLNQNLHYYVNWGDFSPYVSGLAVDDPVQSSTFTHGYIQSGVYQIVVLVVNDAGQSAETSITVQVSEPNLPETYGY